MDIPMANCQKKVLHLVNPEAKSSLTGAHHQTVLTTLPTEARCQKNKSTKYS
jgi:hypothetical protein